MSELKDVELPEKWPYYLGGRPVYANEDLVVTDKFTQGTAARCALADAAAVDKAIELAEASQGALRKLEAWQRKAILAELVAGLKAKRDLLAYSLCVEAGKPIKDAYGEADRCILTFELAMEESTRIYGEFLPLDISSANSGYGTSIVKKFPIGVVSMISPFNFPQNLAAHKIAPALAVGCPWVLKPASRTPLGALIIAEILSGIELLPPGSFSVLPCSRDSADLFTTDPRIKLVSFTGSPSVGWALKARAGKKKVVLELGGNAACIVDEDADIDDAVARVIHGAFYQSGQSCISVQRLLVHERIYDAFLAVLLPKVRALKQGDPKDPSVFIGPLISERDAQRMEQWVQEAVGKGARVLAGGERDGVFFSACVVEGVPRGVKLNDEEVFGPVLTVSKFASFEEAVRSANEGKFGLQCGVFTRDLFKALHAFDELDVGGLVVNDVPSKRVDAQPYGGNRDSGLGREGIRYAIDDMTELKTLIIRRPRT